MVAGKGAGGKICDSGLGILECVKDCGIEFCSAVFLFYWIADATYF